MSVSKAQRIAERSSLHDFQHSVDTKRKGGYAYITALLLPLPLPLPLQLNYSRSIVAPLSFVHCCTTLQRHLPHHQASPLCATYY